MPTDEGVGEHWVEWAKCGRPHGLRGEVRLFLHNRSSLSFENVSDVQLVLADGTTKATKLIAHRPGPKARIVRFECAPGRNEAETLTNARVLVPENVFPELTEAEWYAYELEGLKVIDHVAGKEIGVVERLVDFGAGDLLEVRVGGRTYFLPFAEPYVGEVDLEAGTVEVELDEFLE